MLTTTTKIVMMLNLKKIFQKLLQLNYYVTRFYHDCRLRVTVFARPKKIIVYSMGKVGSTTIMDSLTTLKLDKSYIYHVHCLNSKNINIREKKYQENFSKRKVIYKEIIYSRYLNSEISKGINNKEDWQIITLVRDPIARNISSFFQRQWSLNDYFNQKLKKTTSEEIVEEMIDSFFKDYEDHELHLRWFEDELRYVFDIDVYAQPFPQKTGYKIYEAEKVHLLLLKLENLDKCFDSAFRDFWGIDKFVLTKSNIGQQKRYSQLYTAFLEKIKIPIDYVQKMYDCHYAKYFYTEEEIDMFRKKWMA